MGGCTSSPSVTKREQAFNKLPFEEQQRIRQEQILLLERLRDILTKQKLDAAKVPTKTGPQPPNTNVHTSSSSSSSNAMITTTTTAARKVPQIPYGPPPSSGNHANNISSTDNNSSSTNGGMVNGQDRLQNGTFFV